MFVGGAAISTRNIPKNPIGVNNIMHLRFIAETDGYTPIKQGLPQNFNAVVT